MRVFFRTFVFWYVIYDPIRVSSIRSMIQLEDKIISRDLFTEHFFCHLEKCKGNCCVYGDSGAPLEEDETVLLEKYLAGIKLHMRAEGIRAVGEHGAWVTDDDGEKVTPLVENEECAYALFEDGIARCAIEQAFVEGDIPIQKPVSCHLYPVRISRLNNGLALNYHRWTICEPARVLGKMKNIPVFRFVKDALIRAFGKGFYDDMESVYREIKKEVSNF